MLILLGPSDSGRGNNPSSSQPGSASGSESLGRRDAGIGKRWTLFRWLQGSLPRLMRLAGPRIMRGRGFTIGRLFLLTIAVFCIAAALPAAAAPGANQGKWLGSHTGGNAHYRVSDRKPVDGIAKAFSSLLELAENETDVDDEDEISHASNVTELQEDQEIADQLVAEVGQDLENGNSRDERIKKTYTAAVDLTKATLEGYGDRVQEVIAVHA